jgi:hypothetical protein
LSIQAIDGISPQRSIDRWQDAYAYSNMQQPQMSPQNMVQQMVMMLLQNVLSMAMQSMGNGSNGSNGMNGGGWPGSQQGFGGQGSMPGFGGPGSMPGFGGPGSTQGFGGPGSMPGIGGPGSTQGLGGMGGLGGGDPMAGLMSSLMELLNALAPLLQALGGNGMKPNSAAGGLADQLGGGGGGGGNAGGGAGGAGGGAGGARPQQKPDFTTPAPVSPPVSAPPKTDSSTPVAASSRPGPVLPPHAGEVEVNKPIIVGPGETFDGKNQLFRAGRGLNGGGTAESQDPMFIVAPGGTIKNVQFDGRNGGQLLGDGIHLMGNAKVDNVHAVHGGPDDMITIDGPGNRARDAHLAGIDPKSIPSGPATVEITNSSFRHSHDKAIQINGDANLTMKGVYAEDVGQLAVTLGGKPITANVSIEDSTLNGVRSHTFRFDSRNSTLDIKNVETDNGRILVMAGDPSKVSGATRVMDSTDPA